MMVQFVNRYAWFRGVACILFGGLCLVSCSDDGLMPVAPSFPQEDWSSLTISQGIAGHVWFWEGNFLPSGDPSDMTGRITPVVRWVHVFPPLTWGDLTEDSVPGFFLRSSVPQVDSVRSDSSGFYQVPLPPGRYFLFVKEGDRLFSSTFSPIEVFPDSVTRYRIDVDYKAAR